MTIDDAVADVTALKTAIDQVLTARAALKVENDALKALGDLTKIQALHDALVVQIARLT